MCKLGELSIAVFIIEKGLAVLGEQHMNVHTVAGFRIDGLGHEGCGAAFFNGSVADDVFCYHGVVGHFDNIIKLNLDFKLSGAADFVVMILDFNAPIFHKHAHFAAEIVIPVLRSTDVIAALVRNLETVFTAAGVPIGFFGVNFTANAFGTSLELNIVKHMEFEFRSDDHFVGNAGFTHVFNSALDNVAGILIERAVLGAVDNHCIAAHGEGRNLRKGIDSSGGKVGNEDHIAVFNGRVAVVGTIKADAVFHRVFIKTGGGDGDMTPTTVDVGHFEIDHFNFIVKDEFLCLLNCFKQHG